MITLLPEPKHLVDQKKETILFNKIRINTNDSDLLTLAETRFWNYQELITASHGPELSVHLVPSLDGKKHSEKPELRSQGYALEIQEKEIILYYEGRAGYINGLTSIKMLLIRSENGYRLPCCLIEDWPSVAVRAVAPTFSWYSGYGRIGFDSQLWGYEKWLEFLNICMDNKINQFNMVMYGYWPFEFEAYPETVYRNVPVDIWNAENDDWLTIRYTHPNIEHPYLAQLIKVGHMMEFAFFAYVGLNSYNGAYSIKHPEARMIPPKGSQFLNDFDSLCLSNETNVNYILDSMQRITELGFDGFTLEESEEGFWFCECDRCKAQWHTGSEAPVEAKHKANIWLLNQIWDRVKSVNKDAVLGIRAFRQPPLEKDPAFLETCVDDMPKGINLFWAPGLYVPESEFEKWVKAFGKEHIWARDTEANSITSTMGRLYRTFASNLIRYEDETNEQVIETDIRQHLGSTAMGVHGINGYMFEWYGLFLHLFAHGNYGWGSRMEMDEFFDKACAVNFGELGEDVLYVMRTILTIHQSQMPLYSTPFPFQKNKIKNSDIPAIEEAKARNPKISETLKRLHKATLADPKLVQWAPHFAKLINAQRRNMVIYEMILASLRYEDEQDPLKKDQILDEILAYNEADFAIAKEMFFDINPVGESGVKSSMFPYHEIKRLIHNIRNPENPDNDIICSGIEALGWLWL